MADSKYKLIESPDESTILYSWYQYLVKAFGDKSFTRSQAVDVFFKYTCMLASNNRFNSLLACNCIARV